MAGLSTAAELGERGFSVLVIDKNDIGFEQSGRSSAGIALPEKKADTSRPTLAALAGREWDEFETRWESPVELNREGWIAVAVEDADVEFFEGRHKLQGALEKPLGRMFLAGDYFDHPAMDASVVPAVDGAREICRRLDTRDAG